jgi:hypothetical protein
MTERWFEADEGQQTMRNSRLTHRRVPDHKGHGINIICNLFLKVTHTGFTADA